MLIFSSLDSFYSVIVPRTYYFPNSFSSSSLEESLFEDLCSYFSAEYTLDYGEFCKFAKCVTKKKNSLMELLYNFL